MRRQQRGGSAYHDQCWSMSVDVAAPLLHRPWRAQRETGPALLHRDGISTRGLGHCCGTSAPASLLPPGRPGMEGTRRGCRVGHHTPGSALTSATGAPGSAPPAAPAPAAAPRPRPAPPSAPPPPCKAQRGQCSAGPGRARHGRALSPASLPLTFGRGPQVASARPLPAAVPAGPTLATALPGPEDGACPAQRRRERSRPEGFRVP